jgi:hypothetical protein
MHKLTVTPKRISKVASETITVSVRLSGHDRDKAKAAAESGNETVAEWISSLVNMALKG